MIQCNLVCIGNGPVNNGMVRIVKVYPGLISDILQ